VSFEKQKFITLQVTNLVVQKDLKYLKVCFLSIFKNSKHQILNNYFIEKEKKG